MPGRHRRGSSRTLRVVVALTLVGGGLGVGVTFREDVAAMFAEPGPSPQPGPSASVSPAVPRTGPSPSPEPPREPLVIHGTGDVNLDPSDIPALASNGYAHAWSGLDGLFRDDDLTVVNLECVISTTGPPQDKEFTFRGPPEALPPMAEAGVEVANLGNNHAGDFGPEALLDTRQNLLEAGIAPVGAGKDERQANRPAMFEMGGWTVAVLGFGGVVPDPSWIAGPDHPGMADGDSIPSMVRAVRAADRKADLVFVSIHWGVELDLAPRPEDVQGAHAMIDAGADAIFGHHAHRLQPMDTYRGRPIFWGLGNFVWPIVSEEGSTTAVARVEVGPKGRVTGRLLPAFIESPGHPVLSG